MEGLPPVLGFDHVAFASQSFALLVFQLLLVQSRALLHTVCCDSTLTVTATDSQRCCYDLRRRSAKLALNINPLDVGDLAVLRMYWHVLHVIRF